MEESINADTPAADDSLPSVVRGNRTKRQRLQLPPLPVFAGGEIPVSSMSTAQFSGRITTATDEEEEEEDIANCLILLAMGRALETPIRKPESNIGVEEAETAVKLAAAAAAANGKTGCHVYKCKTCNKCFPSFQALGGHRVSHKKPKLSISSSEKVPTVNSTGAVEEPTASAAASGGKGKRRMHVCSICGVKFTSGQALGGHMRRHRPASHQEPAKKEKSGLSVDLNLPAPSDEDQRSFAAFPKSSSDSTAAIPAVFSFAAKTPLLLLPPALVDCHY